MEIFFCFDALEFQRQFVLRPSKVRKLVRTNQFQVKSTKMGTGRKFVTLQYPRQNAHTEAALSRLSFSEFFTWNETWSMVSSLHWVAFFFFLFSPGKWPIGKLSINIHNMFEVRCLCWCFNPLGGKPSFQLWHPGGQHLKVISFLDLE